MIPHVPILNLDTIEDVDSVVDDVATERMAETEDPVDTSPLLWARGLVYARDGSVVPISGWHGTDGDVVEGVILADCGWEVWPPFSLETTATLPPRAPLCGRCRRVALEIVDHWYPAEE